MPIQDIYPSFQEAVADFRAFKELGQGASATVLKAKHRSTGAHVALKIIREIDNSQESLRAALREVHILRELTSMAREGAYSHATKLYGARLFRDGSDLGLVLILESAGKSLACFDKRRGEAKGSNDSRVKMLYDSLCAFKFLHSAGVMHRDVKPDNLLMAKDGSVKVCDFGLSRSFENERRNRAERRGSLRKRNLSPHVVTRYYRAPEVILQKGAYDESVDIWSLGTSLMEVFSAQAGELNAGENLFDGSSCYPLSPNHKMNDEMDQEEDQLVAILSLLGSVADKDTSFLKTESERAHLRQAQQEDYEPIQWDLEFAWLSGNSMSAIFDKMLQFNPNLRSSADDLLNSKAFDEVRVSAQENVAPWRVEDISSQVPLLEQLESEVALVEAENSQY